MVAIFLLLVSCLCFLFIAQEIRIYTGCKVAVMQIVMHNSQAPQVPFISTDAISPYGKKKKVSQASLFSF